MGIVELRRRENEYLGTSVICSYCYYSRAIANDVGMVKDYGNGQR